MLKDRGTIKWTSLMLPEHVEQLKKLWRENEYLPKPILDEQELEDMSLQCVEAYENKENVQIDIYDNGEIKSIQGIITKLDQQSQLIKVQTTNNTDSIPFTKLIRIKKTS